eukprot:gene11065-13083_t
MAFQAVERVEYNHRAFANGVSYLLFGAFCVITFYLIYTPYSELSERRYYYTVRLTVIVGLHGLLCVSASRSLMHGGSLRILFHPVAIILEGGAFYYALVPKHQVATPLDDEDVEEKLPLPHLYFCPFFYTTDVSPAELDAAFWVDSYEDSSFVRLSCAGIEYTVDGVGNQGELCEEGQEYNDRAVRVRTVELQGVLVLEGGPQLLLIDGECLMGWGTCLTVDLTGLQVVDKKADIQEESYSSRIDGVSRAPMSSELLAGNFKAVSNTMGICSTRTKVKERFTHDAALYLGLSGTTEDTLSYTFAQSTGQLYSPGSIYSLDDSASANVLPFEDTEVILQSLVFESIQVRYYKEYNPISVAFIIGLIG